jgi:hypothetical protein
MSEQLAEYNVTLQRPTSQFRDVHFPDGWLAFRYDVQRGIVEIQRRGQKHYFDLVTIQNEYVDKTE